MSQNRGAYKKFDFKKNHCRPSDDATDLAFT